MSQDEVYDFIKNHPGIIQTEVSINGEPYSCNVAACIRKLVKIKEFVVKKQYQTEHLHT